MPLPGKTAVCLLLTLGWITAGSAAELPIERVPVRLELRLGEQLHKPDQGLLTLTRLDGEEVREASLAGRTEVAIDLPPNSKWLASVDIPKVWSPASQLEVGAVGTGVLHRLFLWPAAEVAGQLSTQKRRRLPEVVELRFEVPLFKSHIERTITTRCPILEEGSFVCPAPAAKVDLRLYAAGYVPEYWWQLRTGTREPSDLGRIELRLGASLAGFVEVAEGAISEQCTARLVHPSTPGTDVNQAQQLKKTHPETRVGDDGFFQLVDVAPGIYLLEVEQPGFQPARVSDLEVWPESETLLRDPLVLHRPLNVELRIDPANDWLGNPWQVEWVPAFDFSSHADTDRLFEGLADEMGRVVLRDQAPGRYFLRIFDSTRNQMHHDFDLFVPGPTDEQIEIRIDQVELRGELLYRDEPVAGSLWFGGRHGAPRVLLQANSDGQFEGVLPREGSWLVDIETPDPALTTHQTVQVKASKKGEAFLEIALPDSDVYGRVVDQEGAAVAGAQVSLSSQVDTLATESEEDGTFMLRAVPSGPAQLAARHGGVEGGRVSGAYPVTVLKGQSAGPFELVLEETREFSGRIVSPRGPVPGAVISWFCQDPPLAYGGSTRSGLDGRFTGRVNGRCQTLRATLRAPGHTLSARLVSLSHLPDDLFVPSDGGTLELAVPYDEAAMRDGARTLLVLLDGVPLSLPDLTRWTLGLGRQFAVPIEEGTLLQAPRLAPGPYRACVVSNRRDANPIEEERCVSGYLAPGSRLRLQLPR